MASGIAAAAWFDLTIESVVRGHHIYKNRWTPVIGEILLCEQEWDNVEDQFAVAVVKTGVVVGHIPRKISRVCWYFLEHQGGMLCEVAGTCRYSQDLLQGGLEVPCLLHFSHTSEALLHKLKELLQ